MVTLNIVLKRWKVEMLMDYCLVYKTLTKWKNTNWFPLGKCQLESAGGGVNFQPFHFRM